MAKKISIFGCIILIIAVGFYLAARKVPAQYDTHKSPDCTVSVTNTLSISIDPTGVKPKCIIVYPKQVINIANSTDTAIVASLGKISTKIPATNSAVISLSDLSTLSQGVHLLTSPSFNEKIEIQIK